MSTSDLYTVFKTKTSHVAEFQNGHGTAPVLWGYLCEKILHLERHSWIFGDKRLWTLAQDASLAKELRLVHGFTFDQAICPMNKLSELADACDKVYTITHEAYPEYANHWQAVAKALREIKPNKRAVGVGLSCTSVSDPWESYKGEGEKKLWDVFEVLQ